MPIDNAPCNRPDADPFYGPGGVIGIAYGYVPVFDVSIDLRIEELDLSRFLGFLCHCFLPFRALIAGQTRKPQK